MKLCSNCNNSIRNQAEFCDKCGEFIEINDFEIKYKTRTSKKLNILKNTLFEASRSIENFNDDTQWYYDMIISYFIEVSNVEEVFNDYGISLLDVGYILHNLKDCPKNEILSAFLTQVNSVFNFQKDSVDFKSNVIIYTNINRKLTDEDYFKKILAVYDLELFNFKNYDEGTSDVFKHDYVMLKYHSEFGDVDFVKNNALNEVNSFFGYLTYINKFNKYTTKYHINSHSLNHNITDLEYNSFILIDSKNKIVNEPVQIEIISNSKNFNESNLKLIKNLPIVDFRKSDKEEILENIKEYFALFYIASFERGLENSFLKFWSLSEKIIKDISGSMKDNKLIKFMKKVLKLSKIPKKMRQRVDVIQIKRNNLVHENKHGEITQYDQTLIKAVAENLILFLMLYSEEVKKLNDYGIILKYSNWHNREKENMINLIKLTMDE